MLTLKVQGGSVLGASKGHGTHIYQSNNINPVTPPANSVTDRPCASEPVDRRVLNT